MAGTSRAHGRVARPGTRRVRLPGVSLAALLAGALAACGARSALPVPGPDSADAAACEGAEITVLPNVPNLYFVLDASGSMLQDSKWLNVRSVVASLIDRLGASARFGATAFPAPGPDTCAAGTERMPLTLGDTQGAVARAFLLATALTPQGGTPTATTFQSLLPKFQNTFGITTFILATDGGPNCGDPATTLAACQAGECCPLAQCTSNTDGVTNSAGMQTCFPDRPPNCCATGAGGCLDGTAAAEAIGALRAIGIQTYVMGIPGSAPYGDVLDAMAVAGGTARTGEPRYYAVGSSDADALAASLGQIAEEAMKSCTFLLASAPVDDTKVNVYLDGTIVPSDGPNGWVQQGARVTLEGGSCSVIQADAAAPPTVRVTGGCPTVHTSG
jgi:von Willebrand factor type A domain